MVDQQDRDKIPPELLEDGDDADLEDISVIVEPDAEKSAKTAEAKANPVDQLELDDEEENLETQKFERYEEPDLTADLEDEEEGASRISMPPVIIAGSKGGEVAAVEEVSKSEDAAPVESESPSDTFRTISISHVQVIGGGAPVENIEQPPLEEEEEAPVEETPSALEAKPSLEEEAISPWSEESEKEAEKVDEIEEVEEKEIEEVEEKEVEEVEEREIEELEEAEAPASSTEAEEEEAPRAAAFDAEIVAAIVEVEAESADGAARAEARPETTAEESTEEVASVEELEEVKEADEPEIVDEIEEVTEKSAVHVPEEAEPEFVSPDEGEEEERVSREEIEPVEIIAHDGAEAEESAVEGEGHPSMPPSKEPSSKPTKEPPPPPKGEVVAVSTPPPPPPPKGVSMKSFADHLPSIISIPEDEIPREEADEAVVEMMEEPEAAEVAEVTEVTEVEEIPSPEPAPRIKKRWYEEVFNEDYLRLIPKLNRRQIKREVAFIEKSLEVQPGGMLLDLACGSGTHCIGLARMGYQMVGLDLSFAMLAIASEEAQAQDCKINFIQKDLRELDFDGVFDGAYCIGSSFGYFDDDDNESVIRGVHRALKPGGMFLLEVDNRDFVMRQNPNLIWFEGDGVVTMEETSFDFITSRLKVKRQLLFEDGTKTAHQYTIRMYAVHELGRMLHKIGFRVGSVGGHRAAPKTFIGEDSAKLIILAQKRYPDET